MAALRKFLLLTTAAAAVVVAYTGVAAAAKPQVTKIDDTFTANLCGVDTIAHQVGVDVFSISGNTATDRYEFQTTFTAPNGAVILLHAAGTVSADIEPTPNGDGTYTAVVTYTGVPEQFRLPGGRVLTQDTGVITFTDLLASNGSGGFTFLSESIDMHGPHPEADSGFALECSLLGPILNAAP
jgi:hypothetical protein